MIVAVMWRKAHLEPRPICRTRAWRLLKAPSATCLRSFDRLAVTRSRGKLIILTLPTSAYGDGRFKRILEGSEKNGDGG